MKIFRNTISFIIITCLILMFITPAHSKTPKKVAILPFTMHADRNLTFLKEGIMDMLATRLAWKGEVEILEKGLIKKAMKGIKGPINRDRAILIGKKLHADYVIMGSLTVFGDSVSIDARILDVNKSEELITAFNQSKGMNEVIPTINKFAQDINEKIMGRIVARMPSSEYSMRPSGPQGLVAPGGSFQGKGIGHVQTFRTEITSLDVADVDGDGKNELIFTDYRSINVYKWDGKTFIKIYGYKGSKSSNYVYVSVADLDRNGKAEVYLSNIKGSGLSSSVLEWDGTRLAPIITGQGWFFRVTDIPGKGTQLIGQKRLVDGSYFGPVRILKREGNKIIPGKELNLPRYANVFNFVQAEFAGPGKVFTVMLDPYERLTLYDPKGDEIWRSEEFFGGALTFMRDKGKTVSMADAGTGKYVYLPSPIYLTDVDGDGQIEVMICKNHSRSGRLFMALRDFSSGKVHFMIWDKMGLRTKWTSRKLTGPVVGYRVSDVDGDGKQELVIASVMKESAVGRKGKSKLVVFDLK